MHLESARIDIRLELPSVVGGSLQLIASEVYPTASWYVGLIFSTVTENEVYNGYELYTGKYEYLRVIRKYSHAVHKSFFKTKHRMKFSKKYQAQLGR